MRRIDDRTREAVRKAVRQGLSFRQAAKRFGLSLRCITSILGENRMDIEQASQFLIDSAKELSKHPDWLVSFKMEQLTEEKAKDGFVHHEVQGVCLQLVAAQRGRPELNGLKGATV